MPLPNLIFQYANFAVTLIATTTGAYTHNWAVGAFAAMLTYFTVFWASDFVIIDEYVVGVWYHIWLSGAAITAGIAGHLYAKATRCPQLVILSTPYTLRTKVHIPWEDISVAVMSLSLYVLAAGIDMATMRTFSAALGFSPIGTDEKVAGIAVSIVAGFVFLATAALCAFLNYDARVTAKYVILLVIPNLTSLYFYLFLGPGGLNQSLSALVSLILLLASYVLVWWVSFYFSVRGYADVGEGVESRDPDDFDPFYGRMMYSLLFYGVLFGIFTAEMLLLNGVTMWFTLRSLQTGAICMICASGFFCFFAIWVDKMEFFDEYRGTALKSYVTINEQRTQKSIEMQSPSRPSKPAIGVLSGRNFWEHSQQYVQSQRR